MHGVVPVPMLVRSSLADTSAQVRSEALDAITGERTAAAVPQYILALRDSQNEIVGRAAVALHRIGDTQAIPPLIEALVTTHQYKVQVIDTAATYSFTRDGKFAPNGTAIPPEIQAGLLAGKYPNGVYIDQSTLAPPKYRVVTIRRDQRNPEVLAALETLTGERYGYDKHMWRLWWSGQKSGAGGQFNNVP
ncbi:MAG: HEAT repeat domain-containing protein [Planctomycetaceae bacterium]